jgi:hypothetical protein
MLLSQKEKFGSWVPDYSCSELRKSTMLDTTAISRLFSRLLKEDSDGKNPAYPLR